MIRLECFLIVDSKNDFYRATEGVSRSSSSRAAISSASLYPSQPDSPNELRRRISAILEVANSFNFFTDAMVGGARSPPAASEEASGAFELLPSFSSRRVFVC